jgi:hypothetical protein
VKTSAGSAEKWLFTEWFVGSVVQIANQESSKKWVYFFGLLFFWFYLFDFFFDYIFYTPFLTGFFGREFVFIPVATTISKSFTFSTLRVMKP